MGSEASLDHMRPCLQKRSTEYQVPEVSVTFVEVSSRFLSARSAEWVEGLLSAFMHPFRLRKPGFLRGHWCGSEIRVLRTRADKGIKLKLLHEKDGSCGVMVTIMTRY